MKISADVLCDWEERSLLKMIIFIDKDQHISKEISEWHNLRGNYGGLQPKRQVASRSDSMIQVATNAPAKSMTQAAAFNAVAPVSHI